MPLLMEEERKYDVAPSAASVGTETGDAS